ncbi:hypothetical protein [Paludibacter sp.]|uniref:hypothetical protein n=1 Tax=Paludibacter sp. TaxID=1898105 RepID=UPI0013549C90|nr:hypothetical protein [Paludibacter sp.]MTK54153.1 hypothetical protein [Paludibacter sp.]
MKNIHPFLVMIFLFYGYLNGSAQSLTEFRAMLKDYGMNITIPDGFIETKVIPNDNMEYDYAIKYPDRDFELRYAIRPILYKSYANDTIRKEIEGQRSFRNTSYGTVLETIILNITGGKEYQCQAFDKKSVKMEFNADWGATSFLELNSGFGKGYKYCMIIAIHKDNVADAYYFYLSNTKANFSANMDPLFHTLKFINE